MVKKNKKIKLIATLGPSSLKTNIIKILKKDVDIFRLNMSHLTLKNLEKNLKLLKKSKIKNICIDTEGAQIRTLDTDKKFLKKNSKCFLSNDKLTFKNLIRLYPKFDISNIKKDTIVKIGFDGLELKILDNKKDYLRCVVTKEGILDTNKGVHFHSDIFLKPLTNKDLQAIKVAKKFGVRIFALSFVNKANDVSIFRYHLEKKDTVISKIETKKGFFNRKKIMKISDAVLVDRGDLSRYIEIPKIPLAQRIIVNDAKLLKKKVYIATNLLETMIKSNEPTRAESNDVYSSLETGCSGLVLAAETAIGNNPVECINFLKGCLNTFYKRKKLLLNNSLFFKNF
jgi:pyruvate kinase